MPGRLAAPRVIGDGFIEGRFIRDAAAKPDPRALRRQEFLRTVPRPQQRSGSPLFRRREMMERRKAYDEIRALRIHLEELRWCLLRERGR